MPSDGDVGSVGASAARQPDATEIFRKSFIKGSAILLPLVVTLLVLAVVFGFIADAISPIVTALTGTALFESRAFVTLLTLLVFVLIVVGIGFLSEYGSMGRELNEQFDEFMSSIPGIGSVYTSFNEVSEMLLDSDTDSFQEVKLVEYPGEDSYVVAFKTAETPEPIAEHTDNDDMITLFMPMAPNPVMGGFVIHVSRERVVDVDLTVEEGIRSIVTSGVAVSEDAPEIRTLDESQMRELGGLADVEGPDYEDVETDEHIGDARSEK